MAYHAMWKTSFRPKSLFRPSRGYYVKVVLPAHEDRNLRILSKCSHERSSTCSHKYHLSIWNTNTTLLDPLHSLPYFNEMLKLLDIDSLELARQLTLMESSLYNRIQPEECLKRSAVPNPKDCQDNIATVVQLSNKIAIWVGECVLEEKDVEKRAIVMKHFITIADCCRSLQNYSSMVAIISGLNNPTIRRLKQTWELVDANSTKQLQSCEALIDTINGFAKYKSTLANITPPAIPFIGVHLTTLSNIHAEGGEAMDERKREVIQDIERWQAISYDIAVNPTVRSYLEESFSSHVDRAEPYEKLMQLSLEREPQV